MHRAVEEFAVGGPAGVVDFHLVGGFRMDGAGAFGEHLGGDAGGGFLRAFGSGGHVFRDGGWLGRVP